MPSSKKAASKRASKKSSRNRIVCKVSSKKGKSASKERAKSRKRASKQKAASKELTSKQLKVGTKKPPPKKVGTKKPPPKAAISQQKPVSSSAVQKVTKSGRFTLCCWNVTSGAKMNDDQKWAKIADVIGRSKADAFIIIENRACEVSGDMKKVEDNLPGYKIFIHPASQDQKTPEYPCIVLNTNTVAPQTWAYASITYSVHPRVPGFWRISPNPNGGKDFPTLSVIGVHLEQGDTQSSKESRQKQFEDILKWAVGNLVDLMELVIIGDFNFKTGEANEVMEFLCSHPNKFIKALALDLCNVPFGCTNGAQVCYPFDQAFVHRAIHERIDFSPRQAPLEVPYLRVVGSLRYRNEYMQGDHPISNHHAIGFSLKREQNG